QPRWRGAGGLHRRGDREPGGHLREIHRHRVAPERGSCAHHRRAPGQAVRAVRTGGGAEGLAMASGAGAHGCAVAGRTRAMAAPPWRVLGIAAVLAGACMLPFAMSGFRLFQFTQVFIYAIALMGLNMLTGYNGQISLGHGAFYAIGAYTTAIMM